MMAVIISISDPVKRSLARFIISLPLILLLNSKLLASDNSPGAPNQSLLPANVDTHFFDLPDPTGPGIGDSSGQFVAPQTFTYNFNDLNNVQTEVQSLTSSLMGDSMDLSTGTIAWMHTDVEIPGNFDIEVAIKRQLSDTGNWYRATRDFGNWSLAIPHVRTTYVTDNDGSFTSAVNGARPAWYRNEACSAGLNSNPNFRKRIKSGTQLRDYELRKEDYWQGDTVDIPGVGSYKLLQDGAQKRTSANWKVDCVSVNGVDSFKVTLPNGTSYLFSHLTTIESLKPAALSELPHFCLQNCPMPPPDIGPDGSVDTKYTMRQVHAFMQVTQITDRFGNWVKYEYDSHGKLDKIHSSDGRLIDITFSGGSQSRVTQVIANGRTWTYAYQSPSSSSSFYKLNKVTLPDSRYWQFQYPSDSRLPFWNNYYISNHVELYPYDVTMCSDGLIDATFIEMRHPSGATGKFNLKLRCNYQAAVPKLEEWNPFGQGGPYQAYELQMVNQQFALAKKTITYDAGAQYQWDYQYSKVKGYFYADGAPYASSFGISSLANKDISSIITLLDNRNLQLADVNATSVTSPDGSVALTLSDRQYGATQGKVIIEATFADAGEPLAIAETHHSKSPRYYGQTKQKHACNTAYFVHPMPPDFQGETCFDVDITSAFHIQTIGQSTIMLDDGVDTWYQTDFSNFNEYEQATEISQTGPSGSRDVRLGFAHHTGTWVLNQPTTVDVRINGGAFKRLSEKSYHSATHSTSGYRFQLSAEKWFGSTRKSYPSYHNTTGMKGQIKDVDLHLDGASTKRRISFSNYKRGKAQTISVPLRYSSGTMSLSKTIDNNGWISSTTDFNGATTYYAYTNMGFISSVDLPRDDRYSYGNWRDTRFSYSFPSAGGLVRTTERCVLNSTRNACTNSSDLTITETYDALYRLKQTKTAGSGENRYQRFSYNHHDQQTFVSYISSSSSESRGTSSDYDALQRLISSTVSGMGTNSIEYLSGNRVKQTNPRGYASITTYRAFEGPSYRLPTLIEAPENVDTQLHYDYFGNVTSITQSGGGKSSTEYRYYDSANNLCLIKRADIGNTAVKMNLMGEMQWQAQGYSGSSCTSTKPGTAVTMTYDNLGDLHEILYPSGNHNVRYRRDNNGNVDRLYAGSSSIHYVYNNMNLLEYESSFISGRAGSLEFNYEYDSSQQLTRLRYPNNDSLWYGPNAFGEPTVVSKSGQTYASDIDFFPTGSVDHFTYGNGVQHNTYLHHLSNLPIKIADIKASSTLVRFDYSYDDNANITRIIDGSDSGYNLNTLSYDGLDRLIGVSGNSKAGNTSVTYDALGNITRLNTKNRNLSYFYTSNHQLEKVTSSGSSAKSYAYFNYDNRGNVTHNSHYSMQYNLANQMTHAKSNEYTYDGHNRRIKARENGQTSYYHYSQAGQLLYREKGTEKTNFIYLQNRLIAEHSNTKLTYVHTDNLGSPVARTNTSASVTERMHYKPFGDTHEAPSDGVGFTGHKFDKELGLSYMQARYYDPVIGRFYSNDPIGAVSHLDTQNGIHGFNRYAYGNNNPYKYYDPDGRESRLAQQLDIEIKENAPEVFAETYPDSGTDATVIELNLSWGGSASFEAGIVKDSHGNKGFQFSAQFGGGTPEGSIEVGKEFTTADSITQLNGPSGTQSIGGGEGLVATQSMITNPEYRGSSTTAGLGAGLPAGMSGGVEYTKVIIFKTGNND
uniref:RHS repeat domain-containing protein n=1 Tax=Ningiella ruwaisensis TaxID=2364274 RepID=UPI0010A06784|nr:RHS repeat-associated core domain-containing protein [Ningiella ruwaisensis]